MISLVKYCAKPVSLTLLFILSLSLWWCADTGCSFEQMGDGCSSLLCAPLHPQSDSVEHSSSPTLEQCSCFAHTPVLPSTSLLTDLSVESHGILMVAETHLRTSPNRLVLRPPII